MVEARDPNSSSSFSCLFINTDAATFRLVYVTSFILKSKLWRKQDSCMPDGTYASWMKRSGQEHMKVSGLFLVRPYSAPRVSTLSSPHRLYSCLHVRLSLLINQPQLQVQSPTVAANIPGLQTSTSLCVFVYRSFNRGGCFHQGERLGLSLG